MDFTQLGASGAVVVVTIAFLKFLLDDNKRRDKQHEAFARSIDKNTQITNETYEFLRKLNGKLEDALIKKATVREAEIEHATVRSVDKRR